MKALITLSCGDMRRALNILQVGAPCLQPVLLKKGPSHRTTTLDAEAQTGPRARPVPTTSMQPLRFKSWSHLLRISVGTEGLRSPKSRPATASTNMPALTTV